MQSKYSICWNTAIIIIQHNEKRCSSVKGKRCLIKHTASKNFCFTWVFIRHFKSSSAFLEALLLRNKANYNKMQESRRHCWYWLSYPLVQCSFSDKIKQVIIDKQKIFFSSSNYGYYNIMPYRLFRIMGPYFKIFWGNKNKISTLSTQLQLLLFL